MKFVNYNIDTDVQYYLNLNEIIVLKITRNLLTFIRRILLIIETTAYF